MCGASTTSKDPSRTGSAMTSALIRAGWDAALSIPRGQIAAGRADVPLSHCAQIGAVPAADIQYPQIRYEAGQIENPADDVEGRPLVQP
jgi:hypothetical protein